MNEAKRAVHQKHIEKAIAALKKNRFAAEYIETPQDLLKQLAAMIPSGSSCSLGGSVTLAEAGVQAWLEARSDITYYDRYADGVDTDKVFHDALCCDYYITGTNALTLQGELYNIDGRGNRVAPICYGPAKVIVIAGYNKIVASLDEARTRVRMIAAPTNATRLHKKTPCVPTGICQDCLSDDRICSQELVTGWQMFPERIHVLLLGGSFGY